MNWGGECQSFTNNLRNCTNLGDWYEDSWKAFERMLMLKFARGNQISSFGPDAGAACVIFTDDGCMTIAGAHATVRYPRIADLSFVKMDKAVGSYICHPASKESAG